MKMALVIMTFIRMLREELMEEPEKKEPMTNRQFLIKMTALSITFFIGLMLFGAIDYVIQLVS